MPTDAELLRQHVKDASEAAFTEIVQRHAGLVYSVALRLVGNNHYLAKDVTQEVFVLLTRKAPMLLGYETLAGWLHTTTRYVASSTIRSLRRRKDREKEAVAMQTNSVPEVQWEQLRPLLDEAVGRLNKRDRNAVVLRYFEGKSYGEVGVALSLMENSARACTERAVEKLRRHFARRGVMTTGVLLAEALTMNAAQAAPAGLVTEVAAVANAKGPSLGHVFLKALYMTTKTKVIIAAAVILLVLGIFSNWVVGPFTTTASKPTQPVIVQLQLASRLSTQVEKPVAPSAPVTARTQEPVMPPLSDAQKESLSELQALMPNIAHDLRVGQGIFDYLSPEDLAKLGYTSEFIAKERAIEASALGSSEDGGMKNMLEAQALTYDALANQIPVINSTGDEATYQIYNSTGDDLTYGMFSGKGNLLPETFIKIQGRWYIKPLD
jgi:RNA polymerase sigma factor (sigma-70 family)